MSRGLFFLWGHPLLLYGVEPALFIHLAPGHGV